MGVVHFQCEPVGTLWSELLPLASDHWREVRWDGDTEADLDCARYEAAEAAGTYRILTARLADGTLIGYAGFWINHSTQLRTRLEASQDCIYVRPMSRDGGLGFAIIRAADRLLADLGVAVVYHHVRTASRNFGPVLRRLGYAPIETTYARRL